MFDSPELFVKAVYVPSDMMTKNIWIWDPVLLGIYITDKYPR